MTDCSNTTAKLSYADEALKLSEKINWNYGIIMANSVLAYINKDCRNDHAAAIKCYEGMAAAAKRSGDELQYAYALEFIAMVYVKDAQYSKALDYYRLAVETKTELGSISALGNMGFMYANIADYSKALTCYDSALKMQEEFIRRSAGKDTAAILQKAGLLIFIADIYLKIQNFDKAFENYSMVLQLSEPRKNKTLAIWALTGIAKVSHGKKEDAKAIEYYNRALEDCKTQHDLPDEANIYTQLSNIYLEKGAVDSATNYVHKALTLAEDKSFNGQLPNILTTFGKIYILQKKYNDAIPALQKAVDLSEKTGALDDEKNAWETLSTTYQLIKQPGKALDAYKHFISLRDSVYNIRKANEITRIDLQSEFDRQKLVENAANKLKMQRQKAYTYSGYAGLLMVLLLSFFIYRNYSQQKKANIVISSANYAINKEKQKADMLLLNILPEEVATELKTNGNVRAKLFHNVTVLFTDFANFTEAGERFSPEDLVAELHNCFQAFDEIIGRYNIEKIKTVGDAYLAVSGLPNPNLNHAADIANAAIECRNFMIARRKELGDRTFAMRIGINSGTVIAGIVGVKKFAYDIWGDTVNTAARMEQYSEPDKINISQTTYELVKDKFTCIDRGEIDAKHKGKMHMYFVEKSV